MTGNLRCRDLLRQKGEGNGDLIPRLLFKDGPVNRPAFKPRRCAGLEPPKLEPRPLQRIGQPVGGRIADPTRGDFRLPHMD